MNFCVMSWKKGVNLGIILKFIDFVEIRGLINHVLNEKNKIKKLSIEKRFRIHNLILRKLSNKQTFVIIIIIKLIKLLFSVYYVSVWICYLSQQFTDSKPIQAIYCQKHPNSTFLSFFSSL